MIFSEAQANALFDIILEKGNHPYKAGTRQARYADYARADFIATHTQPVHEFWYSTDAGASMKLYYTVGFYGMIEIDVRPQTFNPIHEATLQADLQAAMDAFAKSENEKRAQLYSIPS